MGLEHRLHAWAHRQGLQSSPLVNAVFTPLATARYRRLWDKPTDFRGARFVIGKDISLFPSVHNGVFEAEELDAFLPRISRGDTVWDVGGNVGIYAVLLARAAPDGHVVSFEPVGSSRARLAANLALNAVSNVTVEPIALSDHAGTATMHVHPSAPGCDKVVTSSSASAQPGSPTGPAHEVVDVDITTGDDYVATSPHGDPSHIKVDIEGHEPEFVEGCSALLARRRPTLMLEVTPGAWSDARRATWGEMFEHLFALYGDALWLELDGPRLLRSLDLSALEGGHARTIIFPGTPGATAVHDLVEQPHQHSRDEVPR
jgi:FkbM family methyltransferase